MTELGIDESMMVDPPKYAVVIMRCSTCKHWEKAHSATGYCNVNGVPYPGAVDTFTKLITLDMSLCSKWETKDTDHV